MRTRAASVALVLGATFAAALGCSKILNIEPGVLDPDAGIGGASGEPSGKASSADSVSAGSGGGGEVGPGACAVDTDCAAAAFPECRAVVCEASACVYTNMPAGKPVVSQILGNCHDLQCDGLGSVVQVAVATDVHNDGRDCTVDACVQGAPVNTPKSAGAACQQNGGKVCSPAGDCVACIDDGGCPGGICQANNCAPSSCADGMKNGSETAVDCGGPCKACVDGSPCKVAGDCKSHVCTNGVCKAPNCSDKVANGAESDVDCGGFCPACITGETCQVDADCQGGVCSGAICQAPKCNDGKKNGSETDVDCGKGCVRCGDGKACGDGDDCAGGACVSGVCCTPQSMSITCSAKCGGLTNNCGQAVDCGGCAAPAACVQHQCVCAPEDASVTCKNKCGDTPNNCGQTVHCASCGTSSASSSSSSSASGSGGGGGAGGGPMGDSRSE
jgi:hypothetical protein